MNWFWILFSLGWLVCSILTYGITLAYFQREYYLISEQGYVGDVLFAIFLSLTGPFGLLVSYWLSGFARNGLKFK